MPVLRSHLDDSDYRHGVRDMLANALGIAAWGLGPGDRRGDGARRPERAAGAVDDPDGVRRQRAAGVVALAGRRRADVGGVRCGLLRQPALRDRQRATARLLRTPGAAAARVAGLVLGRREPHRPPASRSTAAARAGTGPLFRRRCDHDLADLADLLDRLRFVVRPDSLALGPGFCWNAGHAGTDLRTARRPQYLGGGAGRGAGGGGRHGLPLKLNILVAIAAAVCAGLLVQQTEKLRDRWTEPESRR